MAYRADPVDFLVFDCPASHGGTDDAGLGPFGPEYPLAWRNWFLQAL